MKRKKLLAKLIPLALSATLVCNMTSLVALADELPVEEAQTETVEELPGEPAVTTKVYDQVSAEVAEGISRIVSWNKTGGERREYDWGCETLKTIEIYDSSVSGNLNAYKNVNFWNENDYDYKTYIDYSSAYYCGDDASLYSLNFYASNVIGVNNITVHILLPDNEEGGWSTGYAGIVPEDYDLSTYTYDSVIDFDKSINRVGNDAPLTAEQKSALNEVFREGMRDTLQAINDEIGVSPRQLGFTSYVLPTDKNAGVKEFVSRMYKICLDREADEQGFNNWVNAINSGAQNGTSVAYGFVFSEEFRNKNLCNEDYVKSLYRAFLGREAEAQGLESWVKVLESGATREEVFNGFARSNEFSKLCFKYGIAFGNGIDIPKFGTVPTGKCSVCGKESGVAEFVTRLYNVCLDRTPDAGGFSNWCTDLWNHSKTGTEVASGFIFSEEFKNKGLNNEDYVEYMYKAFFNRASDAAGKAGWVKLLNEGHSKEEVFEGFSKSQEFTNLCSQYGILR